MKWAGFCGLLATLVALFAISRFWLSAREALIPGLLLLLYQGEIIWAVSGLETTVYQALLAAAVYCCYRGLGYTWEKSRTHYNHAQLFTAGLVLTLAALTRPEAVVVIGLFFLLLAWDKIPNSTYFAHLRALCFFLIPLLVFYSPYFIWRYLYYGYLFPNPVYCKGFSHALGALDYNYLRLCAPLLLGVLGLCWARVDKRFYFLSLPSIAYLMMLINADPIVAFGNRLFLPAFALLLPLVVYGLRCLVSQTLAWRGALWLAVFLLAWFAIPKMTLEQYHYFTLAPMAGEQLRLHVVSWLNEREKPGDKVVLADAGLIPYHSSMFFIDSYCLNNTTMAHDKAVNKYTSFCHQVIKEQPKTIILTSLKEQGNQIYTPADLCLKKELRHHQHYQLTKTLATSDNNSSYQYEIYTSTTN